MADRYLIFSLAAGSGSRHRKVYLLPDGKWGGSKAQALCGSLGEMRALAQALKADHPFLIIERLDER